MDFLVYLSYYMIPLLIFYIVGFGVLQKIVEQGNTVVVIEHNLDVLKSVDYLIDMGPEGGIGGGQIIAQGTPEQIAQCPSSYTGQFLSEIL